MPLRTGDMLENRYRIVKLLGQGGFGAVYRGWDTRLNIPVAVKENLDSSQEAQRQFGREAGMLARLQHTNLPRVTDYFFIPNQGQYLVMDFIEGEDLQTMVERSGALEESTLVPWITQVCEALGYLHSQNPAVIHRDIKPANIIARSDGKVMLVDFGIAKVYDAQMATTMGAKAVTPGFSPPEQYGGGKTDPRSDFYALGATMYYALTGKIPPESVELVVESEKLSQPTQINSNVSENLEMVILKCMEVPQSRRFQEAREITLTLSQPTTSSISVPVKTAAVASQPVAQKEAAVVIQPAAQGDEVPEQVSKGFFASKENWRLALWLICAMLGARISMAFFGYGRIFTEYLGSSMVIVSVGLFIFHWLDSSPFRGKAYQLELAALWIGGGIILNL